MRSMAASNLALRAVFSFWSRLYFLDKAEESSEALREKKGNKSDQCTFYVQGRLEW